MTADRSEKLSAGEFNARVTPLNRGLQAKQGGVRFVDIQTTESAHHPKSAITRKCWRISSKMGNSDSYNPNSPYKIVLEILITYSSGRRDVDRYIFGINARDGLTLNEVMLQYFGREKYIRTVPTTLEGAHQIYHQRFTTKTPNPTASTSPWPTPTAPNPFASNPPAPNPSAPFQSMPKQNNYGDIPPKLIGAVVKIPAVGSAIDEFGRRVVRDVKSVGKDPAAVVATVIVGLADLAGAARVLVDLAAKHTALPGQIPEIPFDWVYPGISMNVAYEGPIDHPTKFTITLNFKPKDDPKKNQAPQPSSGSDPFSGLSILGPHDRIAADMHFTFDGHGRWEKLDQVQLGRLMETFPLNIGR